MNNAILFGKEMKRAEITSEIENSKFKDKIFIVQDETALKDAFFSGAVDLIAFSATEVMIEKMVKLLVNMSWRNFRISAIDIASDLLTTEKFYICYKGGATDIFGDFIFTKRYTFPEVFYFVTKKREKLRRNRLTVKLKSFLVKIGVYSNLLGYDYLIYAVLETVKDRRLLNSMTTKLYPLVAENFSTVDKNVERNIRNAIEVGFNRGKFYKEANILGGNFSANEKPSNGEFIAFLVDMLTD